MIQSKLPKEYATFSHMKNREFSFSEVPHIIQSRSEELTREKYLSYEEITVSLYSPNMINLTLVDLPGITEVPTDDQPKDFVNQVKEMVRERIEN